MHASAVGDTVGAVLEQKGLHMPVAVLLNLKGSTVSSNENVWLLSLLSNTSGIICLDDHSFNTQTISHFNGLLLRRWRADCADGSCYAGV